MLLVNLLNPVTSEDIQNTILQSLYWPPVSGKAILNHTMYPTLFFIFSVLERYILKERTPSLSPVDSDWYGSTVKAAKVEIDMCLLCKFGHDMISVMIWKRIWKNNSLKRLKQKPTKNLVNHYNPLHSQAQL